MKKYSLLLAFLLLTIVSFGQTPLISATSKAITIKDGNRLRTGYWRLVPSANPDIYKTSVETTKIVTFYTDIDSISFTVEPERKYDFIILLNDKDSCHTQISTVDEKLKIDYAPYRVDTSNIKIREILNTYQDYYWVKQDRRNPTNWNKYEVDKSMIYDDSYQHLIMNVIEGNESRYKLFIMSIDSIYNSEKYQVKAFLSQKNGPESKGFSISLIHKITAYFENNKVVFENNSVEMAKDWEKANYGIINYTYHPSYKFDVELAKKANNFIDSICSLLKVNTPTKPIEYTLVRDFNEFTNLLGFEYYSYQFTSGVANTDQSSIKSMKGPFHAHELVHLATKFSCDFILFEGIATFLGTKLVDKEFYKFGLNRFREYIKSSDKEIRYYFENPISNNYKYDLGSYIFEFIESKYGIDKVIYLLNLDTKKEYTLLEGIAKTTGLSEEEFLKEFEPFILNFDIENIKPN